MLCAFVIYVCMYVLLVCFTNIGSLTYFGNTLVLGPILTKNKLLISMYITVAYWLFFSPM